MSEVSGRPARKYYIANPDPIYDVSEDESRQPIPYPHSHNNKILTSVHSPYSGKPPTPSTLLTTNLLPDHGQHFRPSRSNPALSSPSSTSSQAIETTPPPSTPGASAPNVNLFGDGPLSAELPIISSTDREGSQATLIPRIGKTYQPPPQTTHLRRPTGSSPQTRQISNNSPTSHTIDSQPTPNGTSSVAENVVILVTSDSEKYHTVEIGGAKNPAFIRERIFTKLCIWDEEDQAQFSIYQTEVNAFAIGEALSDERLFNLCREHGDPKGSLKLFVSHSSAPVHEQVSQPPVSVSPVITTIPPPVLPLRSGNYGPLRPKRRSRSRHGSISSTSERFPVEVTGYEASVSDDLEKNPRDKQRTPHNIRSPPQAIPNLVNPGNIPPSPRGGRRPSVPRPRSPVSSAMKRMSPQLHTHLRAQASDLALIDKYGSSVSLPPPPPLSPNRATFAVNDNKIPPPIKVPHARSGSESAAERDRFFQPTEITDETVRPRLPEEERVKSDRPQRDLRSRERRPQPSPDDSVDSLSQTGSWVVLERDKEQPPTSLPSAQTSASNPTPRSTNRIRAPRYKATSPYTGPPLAIPNAPRNPPPAPPVSANEARNTPTQPAGQPVPDKWFVMWKSADKVDTRRPPPSNVNLKSLAKIDRARSFGDLRGAAHNHPAMLQPGRRPSHVNYRSNVPNSRDGTYMPVESSHRRDPAGGSLPGVPKSFDNQRTLLPTGRPLPAQGGSAPGDSNTSPQSQYGRGLMQSPNLTSPYLDPYARPQSALGDSPNSPSPRYLRRMPSLNPGSNAEQDSNNPRSLSPSRLTPGQPMKGYDSRLNAPGSSAERAELYGSSENRLSPPRSPASPRNPRPLPRGLGPKSSSISESPRRRGSIQDSGSGTPGSEDTLRAEDREWLRQMVDGFSIDTYADSATMMAGGRTLQSQRSLHPILSPQTPTTPHSESVLDEDSESDKDEGTSIWKVPPVFEAPSSGLKSRPPPLKVQTSTMNLRRKSPSPPLPPPQPRPAALQPSKGPRESTFTERYDSTWAPRPPPEDVYDRLEEFFPNHDLDKPVIEASSGGTSPTTAEHPAISPPPAQTRVRGKKSIRIVAEEHKKRIDRNSRAESSSFNVLRKRSTKLWGSRLEEVTSASALVKAGIPPAVPESPSSGPKPIFKWVRGELIGRGTYGKVYLALNATTGEMIAVKQVEIPRSASDRDNSRQVTVVQALKLESETLKDLDHPNIVQYLGFEETPSFLSIFLEYVPGGCVGNCLQKHGKFDEQVTKSFTAQIIAGLEYLHSKNILHRDLKADNILVETSGICKISDFGISKRTDEITGGGAHTAMQGTVFWMAPEVINTQPKGYYNFKIDIWSVGCVVLEMWTGSRPWAGEEQVAVMFKLFQSKEPPPVPEDIVLSDLALDFRQKCFAINPEERLTAAELRKHPYLTLTPGWVFTGFK